MSTRIAGALWALGLRPGDRVTVQAEKSVEHLILYFACLRAGLVFQPLNTSYQPAELEYFFVDAQPACVICAPDAADTLGPLARAAGVPHLLTLSARGDGTLVEAAQHATGAPDVIDRSTEDVAAILYSSGTTGRPKGAMLSHGNLASNGRTLAEAWGFTPTDRLLHALPLYHAHGLFVAVSCTLLSGGSMLFLPRFEPGEVVTLLPQATVFMGVPTYYSRLLSDPALGPEACRGIRLFVSGSAPLLADTFETFQRRTGHAILERYGLTETLMNTSNPLVGERVPGSVGPALPGVSVRIAAPDGLERPPGETGEIQICGPNIFAGYWRKPEQTAESFTADGWFRTGDLGRIDGRGYVFIVGRAKDLIISGGLNVYPKEVEDCIDSLDGVAESAVVGIRHPDFGEAVAAVVVCRDGAAPIAEADVIGHVRGRLAAFKAPKRVVFLSSLPRNAMGKVVKQALRDLLASENGKPSRSR
jgi:malonyl-CoA/methylmalonyl-CoA synthetase